MYQKEWDRLSEGLLEGLEGYIEKVHYEGTVRPTIAQMRFIEYSSPFLGNIRHNDADYDDGAKLKITALVVNHSCVEYCKSKIGDILQKLGYELVNPMPFCFSCDGGPITLYATFKRTIEPAKVTYALDEE